MGEKTSGALFTTKDGRKATTRHDARRFSEGIVRAGIRGAASAHTLRHTFATGLYRRTGDILLVRKALRHHSIASTLTYARSDADSLRRAMA